MKVNEDHEQLWSPFTFIFREAWAFYVTKKKKKSYAFVMKVNDEQVTNLYFKKIIAHLSISLAKLLIEC